MNRSACLFITEETHRLLNADQVWRTGQAPYCCSYLLGRHYHLTRINRWSECVGHILQTFTHNEISLLLANGTLHRRMYTAGKVTISRHLFTLGFPLCDHTVCKLRFF